MISQNTTDSPEDPTEALAEDEQLVLKIAKRIPDNTWDVVIDGVVEHIVDELSQMILVELTRRYLYLIYNENPLASLFDLVHSKGDYNALMILESLNLEDISTQRKQEEPANDQS
jgi:hypothetical protein